MQITTPEELPLAIERGVVTNLFPAEQYGLLRTTDGRELIFRLPTADGEADHLNLGTPVLFREELTDNGPEAVDVAVDLAREP
jgi:hypothetical protein